MGDIPNKKMPIVRYVCKAICECHRWPLAVSLLIKIDICGCCGVQQHSSSSCRHRYPGNLVSAVPPALQIQLNWLTRHQNTMPSTTIVYKQVDKDSSDVPNPGFTQSLSNPAGRPQNKDAAESALADPHQKRQKPVAFKLCRYEDYVKLYPEVAVEEPCL